jgi:hypothetical protein
MLEARRLSAVTPARRVLLLPRDVHVHRLPPARKVPVVPYRVLHELRRRTGSALQRLLGGRSGATVSEADELARAQAALDRRRAERPADRLASAGAVLGALGESVSELGTPSIQRCACGARLVLSHERERGACDACASPPALSPLAARVPALFRWASLEAPLIPPGSAAPAVLEEGRLAARAWLDSGQRLLTITAEVPGERPGVMVAQTGAGKTTLAAAVGNAWAARGLEFEWVSCRDLNPQHGIPERAQDTLRRATRAKRVIFDGLGKELAGASEDAAPGVAVQRKLWMSALIEELHEQTDRTYVFTVDLTSSMLNAAHGSNAFRRLARNPHGTVIRLQRTSDMTFDRY